MSINSSYSAKKIINQRNAKAISLFEYFFVLVLIIYAGRANIYVASISVLKYPVWILVPVILCGILALKWRVEFTGKIYLLILGFLIYFLGISIKYHEIRPTYFLNYAIIFLIAYISIRALKADLFKIYELLICLLAVIDLFFWGLQIIAGGDTLYNLLGRIPGIDIFSNVTGNGFNAILYSVQPSSASLQLNSLIPRNSGFAWEPGGFAAFLSLAIFFNLFSKNSDRNSKIRFWILTLALVSTQSTTGYVIFVVILLFYYLNKKISIVLLLLPVIIALLVLLFTLPFMSEKIIKYIDEAKQVDYIVAETIGSETTTNPQRFTSFLIAFRDFLDNPVLGLGGKEEERWTSRLGANVSTISGIGNLLAQFGLTGFLFFIIVSYRTSVFFSEYFNYKGKILFFLIFILISISYSIILLPLLMSFWMFGMFAPRNLKAVKDISITDDSHRHLRS